MAHVRVHEDILAPPDARAIVRHIRVRGSNADIGEVVAGLATLQHGASAEDLLSDTRYVRARRTYLQRTYPIHAARMRGVARAFGLRPDDDRFDFSILRYGSDAAGPRDLLGTASYTPGWTAGDGHSLLSRDGTLPESREAPLELYVMEWRPTGDLSGSIAVHVNDLLSGAIVGINGAGLGVSAVGLGMPAGQVADRPDRFTRVSAIGLHELGLVRLVLDTCRTVDEAQASLLTAHVFPMTALARYLIADANGRSFVYETSLDHGAQTIVDGGGDPQVISSWWDPERRADLGWRCVVDLAARTLEVTIGAAPSPRQRGAAENGCVSSEDRHAQRRRLRAAI